MDALLDLADKWIMAPIMVLIFAALAVGLLSIPYWIYKAVTYVPPTEFSLRVDSWECTKSHQQDRRVCAKGCYWRHETICDQWSAKQ